MKRIIILIFIIVGILAMPVFAYGMYQLVSVDYKIIINGCNLVSDLPILNYNGNTYIPLRKVSEATGADVKWDEAKRQVIINTSTPKKYKVFCNNLEITDASFLAYSRNGEIMFNLKKWLGYGVGSVETSGDKLTASKGDIKLEFTVGSTECIANGKKVPLSTAVEKTNNEIYVPLKSYINVKNKFLTNQIVSWDVELIEYKNEIRISEWTEILD